jgi:hypothetical protein
LLGVVTLPVVTAFFSPPQNVEMHYPTLAASGALTLMGAYVGHLIVKPARIPTS